MHLHYVPSPPPPEVDSTQSQLEAPGGAPEVGLLDMYRAKLGILPPPTTTGAGLGFWGRIPLKKLMAPSQRDSYCPRVAASVASPIDAGGTEPKGAAPSALETDMNKRQQQCLSPRVLPAPIEAWWLPAQKYTYDWWSKSAEKEVQYVPDSHFVTDDDLILVLTVTVVPHNAYDGNRHEVGPLSRRPWRCCCIPRHCLGPMRGGGAQVASVYCISCRRLDIVFYVCSCVPFF